jgi:outer membrane protein assembly factor BamD
MLEFLLTIRNKIGIFPVLFLLFSCVGDPNDLPENMKVSKIITLGNESLLSEDYGRAGDYFMEVNRLYPYSDEARISLIEAAKAYHMDSDLLNARLATQTYLTIYSNSKDAPFAKYLTGLTYFDAIIDVNRDQGAALEALKEFEELIVRYPDSPYAGMAKQKFDQALAQLAGQEMTVGRFYLKREKYLAAINRFETVFKKFPNTPYAVEALYRLVEANLSIGIFEKAKGNLALLKERFPESEWTSDAEKLMVTVPLKDR